MGSIPIARSRYDFSLKKPSDRPHSSEGKWPLRIAHPFSALPAAAIARLGWVDVNGHSSPHPDTGGGAGANGRWEVSGYVYPGRIDLRTFVSCASFFSVGGYVRFHMLAGGILLRFRLRHAPGQTRGLWLWLPLTAEQALEKTHLSTPISPILA